MAVDISIHALHEESDPGTIYGCIKNNEFHALHEESDPPMISAISISFIFQSTLSMRRATQTQLTTQTLIKFQSTLSMRRATVTCGSLVLSLRFQSTLSMRRATRRPARRPRRPAISIHALHEESDLFFGLFISLPDQFQSTLSMRRATSYSRRRSTPASHFNPRSP